MKDLRYAYDQETLSPEAAIQRSSAVPRPPYWLLPILRKVSQAGGNTNSIL